MEQAYDNPHEALSRIKRHLLTQRAFKEVRPLLALEAATPAQDSVLASAVRAFGGMLHVLPLWCA